MASASLQKIVNDLHCSLDIICNDVFIFVTVPLASVMLPLTKFNVTMPFVKPVKMDQSSVVNNIPPVSAPDSVVSPVAPVP